jgi:hypothetical protein
MKKIYLADNNNCNGAEFSKDKIYRYALWRIWDSNKPLLMLIGLNPSRANEKYDDPTIRKVIKFAKGWTYGGIYMMNLFAFITPYPNELLTSNVSDNDEWLMKISSKCDKVVFAWGIHKEAIVRSREIIKLFPNGYYIDKSKNNIPKHPLYLKPDLQLQKFNYEKTF